jgi:hypothetical protein
MKMSNPDNSSAAINYDNIIIENVRQEYPAVTLPGREATRNTILGLDDARKFKNITFKNCYYNGKWLGSFQDGNFLVNKYVENISFIFDSISYQISLTKNNEAGGTVSGGGIYTHGIKATIAANPANGYTFSGWMVGDLIVSATPQYTFTVVKDLEIKAIFTLSTNVSELDSPFKIYPNPATDKLFINAVSKSINKIELIDSTGRVVYTDKEVIQNKTIDLSGFLSGFYFVRVHTAEDVITTKVTINRN